MGAIGKEENLEEVLAPVSDVFSVLTDINLAHSWGQTPIGSMRFPQDVRMKIGQTVILSPKGMKEECQFKIKVIHFEGFIEMDVIEGPLFGTLRFNVEPRPYGTLLSAVLDYRIERMGFNLKWKVSERKKYHSMMSSILSNVKNFSEMKAGM
ncbi:MAG: hypothetical protein JW939_08135 [Candidatus Thermoplasmatota archaeon]|nr:hypothetical protein [Candidatus Thermoplasmatota archaeon]